MDILRLGTYNNVDPTYLPDKVVEGFTSKIWTERFLLPGEFELKTPYVDEMMDILPEKTFISHRHTREVMQVETHSISTDDLGQEELTIRGRSVDAILESRFVEGRYNKRRKMAKQYGALGAALVLVWNSVANNSDPCYDVSRQRKDGEDNGDAEGDGERWEWTPKDRLPNVAVSDSTAGAPFTVRRWWLKEGMLYDQLTRILENGELGIRTIRPPSGAIDGNYGDALGEKVRVRTALANFGEIVREPEASFTQLRFDIYVGRDKRVGSGAHLPVVFSVRRDDFDKAEHLYSIKDWKTALEVRSGLNRKWDIYRNATQKDFTGWDRRVFDMDAGEPDIPDPPDKPGKNASQAQKDAYEEKYDRWIVRRNRVRNEFEEDYKKDGKKELKAKRKVYLFSGDISSDSDVTYKYKIHYQLGDRVSLADRDGVVSDAIVSEYTLVEDGEGERGFPGLELDEG